MVFKGLTIGQKSLKEHLEIIGHKEAFEYVVQLVTEKRNVRKGYKRYTFSCVGR